MTVIFPQKQVSGFRREKHKLLFSKSKPYSMTSKEHVSIDLTLGGLLRPFYLCFCLVSIDH